MAVRTVRLDDETEAVLAELIERVGLSVSEVLKRGVLALRDELARKPARAPYSIYEALDLGPGGYAVARSTDARRGVREALRRKHGR
jgi:hypothetical protein